MKNKKTMKTLRFFTAAAIVCCTIAALTSCQSKADKAVERLNDLVTRLEKAGADYQSETWQQATKEYGEILSDMQKCKIPSEKRMEIQQLNAKYNELKVAALTISADKFVASRFDDGKDVVKVIRANDARVFYTAQVADMIEGVYAYNVATGTDEVIAGSEIGYIDIIGLAGNRLFYEETSGVGGISSDQTGYVDISNNEDHAGVIVGCGRKIVSGELKILRYGGYEYSVSTTLTDSEYKALCEKWDAEEAKRNTEWLQGTWEYSGYDPIAGQMSVRLIIDGDYARWYGNGKLMDSGHLEIDPEEERISFGQYTGLDIDMARQIIYTGGRSEGTYMRKSTGGGSSGSSYSGRGSNGNTSRVTTFTTSSEVMAYVGNKFRNRSGNVIRVKSYGIICNGTQITNGVRVVSFNGSRATLTATSPYAQGTQHFYVDASRGTITDGTGDVFYIQ